MRIEEAPDPRPGPGEVLVKVHAVGINPVETYIRSGTYTPRPQLPYTPGTDAAGTVEAIGEGVRDIEPGDRVYSAGTVTGAYADKVLCGRFQVHRLPQGVPFAKGAAVGVPYSAAYRALFQRAGAVPADLLLIHGADGVVGVAAMQFARARGMTIIATVGSEEGRELAGRQGARHIVNHFDADHVDRILALHGRSRRRRDHRDARQREPGERPSLARPGRTGGDHRKQGTRGDQPARHHAV